jgi:hypothetical protein
MTYSTMGSWYIQGGYTSLLLGGDQDATSTVGQLHFDGVSNNENIYEFRLLLHVFGCNHEF